MSNPLRIVVAEDEPMNQRRLLRLLEDGGGDVVASFGDVLSLEAWMGTGPEVDVLFLDIRMPGLDGLALRGSLNPLLPVVFVAARGEQAMAACGLDAVDVLLKPATTEGLARALAKVRRALGRDEAVPDDRCDRGGRYPVLAGSALQLVELQRTSHFEVAEQVVWAFAGERFRTKWKTLGEVEAFFPEAGLLRIHSHLLVRPEAVLGLRANGGAGILVRLAGGLEVEASCGAAPKLKARLGLE